ncbi:MAG: lytic transglycosylase domain-containing protein [Gemmatimonadetes bacterium]|nr:lytic transglycosylase domain-containing protein [Gemmatimonadota bacterium]
MVAGLALLQTPAAQAQASARVPAPAPGSTGAALSPGPHLPLPTGLAAQVDFWKAIYSRVGTGEVLFHDRNHMDVIYGSLDVPEPRTGAAEAAADRYLVETRERYRRVLRSLAAGFDADTLSGEARRIHGLFGRHASPGTFAEAAENVRWQRGLRERFIQGVAFSGRYQSHVEQIFREEGVPVELTYLPFVESMYNITAYSSVGAAGIWQFMPGTGRLFMRVDGTVDERMDPIRAARAAARLLRQNHDRLGTWPLAITAYNHGPYGMMTAVRTMGTRDIERIVKFYKGKAFGFASRNFYTEFLAALEVRRGYREYFGDIRVDPAMEFAEFTLPVAARFSTIARALEVPVEALWEVNPAITANARRQDRPIPAGFRLRLPQEVEDEWDDVLDVLRARRTEAPPARRGGTG